jgi:hypothetical protein
MVFVVFVGGGGIVEVVFVLGAVVFVVDVVVFVVGAVVFVPFGGGTPCVLFVNVVFVGAGAVLLLIGPLFVPFINGAPVGLLDVMFVGLLVEVPAGEAPIGAVVATGADVVIFIEPALSPCP